MNPYINTPVIGIDIGGTAVKDGIVNVRDGRLVGEAFRVPTPQPATPLAVVETAVRVAAELFARPDA